MSEWGHMHQRGSSAALPLRVPRGLLGGELRIASRGPDTQTQYGCTCSHLGLPAHHP